MLTILNWREIEILTKSINAEIAGHRVERVYVPARSRFREGYLKGEWAFELYSAKRSCALIMSVRSRSSYLALSASVPGKASRATRSAFDLYLSKQLEGLRLDAMEVYPKERCVWLGFQNSPLRLVFYWIPAHPEALLIEEREGEWFVLARSHSKKPVGEKFEIPSGLRAPQDVEVRAELVQPQVRWLQHVEESLEQEAFTRRVSEARRAIQHDLKQIRDRLRQASTAATEAEKEPDWQAYAVLFSQVISTPPPLVNGARAVWDYAQECEVQVPGDSKLSVKEQMEQYFFRAKRKKRRIDEASERARNFEEKMKTLEAFQDPVSPDWEALNELETQLGLNAKNITPAVQKARGWPGRTYHSRDGWLIHGGRNVEENLELTFRYAKGNDLWLHAKGKKGAHVIVQVPPGKSVPLETLLDAAHIAIHLSGGDGWGKTEVDYTHRKYVKKIKDSTQVSYSQNKTLMIDPDPERLKRLLSEHSTLSKQ